VEAAAQALALLDADAESPMAAAAYYLLGSTALDRGDRDGAAGHLRRSLAIREALADRLGVASAGAGWVGWRRGVGSSQRRQHVMSGA